MGKDILQEQLSAFMDFDSISNNILPVQGIYKIKCIANEKIYIGQSVNIKCRTHEHRRALEKGKHNNEKMQHSYDKYGKDSFIISLVEVVKNYDDLNDRENYWINYYNCLEDKKGFNICPVKKGYLPTREWGNKVRGSKNGNSKLTEKDIPAICKLLSENYTYEEIGKMFNVGKKTIKDIEIGRTWKHISYKYLEDQKQIEIKKVG